MDTFVHELVAKSKKVMFQIGSTWLMNPSSLAQDGDGDAVGRHADQRHHRQPHALRGERVRRQQRRPLLREEET